MAATSEQRRAAVVRRLYWPDCMVRMPAAYWAEWLGVEMIWPTLTSFVQIHAARQAVAKACEAEAAPGEPVVCAARDAAEARAGA